MTWTHATQVWITSFAEKGTSPKQRKMDAKLAALRDALEKIRIAAGGDGGAPNMQVIHCSSFIFPTHVYVREVSDMMHVIYIL
jgi:hypothetical protein